MEHSKPDLESLVQVEDIQDLYENAPCAYLLTLPDGTIIRANATFFRWTGYDQGVLDGKVRFQDLLAIAGRIYHDTHYGPLLLMQGYVNELAFDVNCKDGKRLPVFLSAILKRNEDGHPLLVKITLVDARGRRAYEQELLAAKRRAEAAESALRTLNSTLEAEVAKRTAERDQLWRLSQDILAVGSTEGYFIRVNPAFTAVLGWTDAEVCSFPFSELVHPEETGAFLDAMDRLRAGEALSNRTGRRRHKDGSYRWISWNIVPDAGSLYFVGRDITEEKRQAEYLRQMEENLQQAQKMEAVGQLTGGLAHDFNNLLAGIVGNLQLMRLRFTLGHTDDLLRYIDAAETVAGRASALTHRMLSFARRQTLSNVVLDVTQLIESMVDMFAQTVGPDIRIHTALESDLGLVKTDRNQLESALLNLVINARDAMPDGGTIIIETKKSAMDTPAGMAETPLTPSQESVIISVRDTGSGMSPDVASRAFEPFFTTKPIGQGTGLGLSMIFGFVKQSGGHVEIRSQVGTGTTVSLRFPRYVGEPADPKSSASAEGQSAKSSMVSTILLVDDEAPLRILLAEVLENEGHAVVQAETGAQALAALEQRPDIDLLVTDIGLPGDMNGRQLAKVAKRLRPDLKTILITGYVQDAEVRNDIMAGDTKLLVKPFALSVFTEEVAKTLQA